MTSERPTARPAQLTLNNAATWQHPDAVAAYVHRAPYPDALLARLASEANGGQVLDLGCGTGAITRPLAAMVSAVDGVDISSAMLAEAQRLPGGMHEAIRWVQGAAESAPLDGPYDLIVAAASLHWMDWGVLLPRLADVLAPDARLAVVTSSAGRGTPWRAAEDAIIPQWSVMPDYQGYDLPNMLVDRDLWTLDERVEFGPVSFEQTVEEYIEHFHSTSGFRREAMGDERARQFDELIRGLVEPHAEDGRIDLDVVGMAAFGRPHARP